LTFSALSLTLSNHKETTMLHSRLPVIAALAFMLTACADFRDNIFQPAPDPQEPLTFASSGAAAPISADEHAQKGRLYLDKGLYGLAETEFRASLELKSRNPEAWLGLAASYDNLRRFDLADRAYRQVSKLLGVSAVVLNNEGYSQLMRGNLKKARVLFLKAQQKDPLNPMIARNLGKVDEALKLSLPGRLRQG
jgi:Flp pilus assembly protein TadD